MKKILLPMLLITVLSGCSLIALPFKAVGSVGSIISKNDSKNGNEVVGKTVVMQSFTSAYSAPKQQNKDI